MAVTGLAARKSQRDWRAGAVEKRGRESEGCPRRLSELSE